MSFFFYGIIYLVITMKQKIKEHKKLIIIILVIICGILLDSGITFLIKKHPILSWKEKTEEKNYIIHGLFYNIYGCYNFDILSEEWAGKTKKLECGDSEVLIKPSFLNYKEYKGYFFDKEFGKVIDNKDDLKEITSHIPEFDGKYGNNFFKEKSLVVAYKPFSSGSISSSLESVLFSNTIVVRIKTDRPEIGTTDMSGIIYFIEIQKNLAENKTVSILEK